MLHCYVPSLKKTVQVFVANPKKPPQIETILRRNKEKLLAFLKTFHNDKEDEQFTVCHLNSRTYEYELSCS